MPCSCNRSIFSFAVVSDMQMNWVINSVKHVHLNILELCQVIPPPTPPLLNSKNSLPSTFLTCLLLEHHVPFLNLYIVSFQKYSLFAAKCAKHAQNILESVRGWAYISFASLANVVYILPFQVEETEPTFPSSLEGCQLATLTCTSHQTSVLIMTD